MTGQIEISSRALVVLCGPSAAGKSTWSRRHFTSNQVISSDHCRTMVSDELHWRQPVVSNAAFKMVYTWTEQRLRLNRMAVVDSTALWRATRKRLLQMAGRWGAPAVLVIFESEYNLCCTRDKSRKHSVGPQVLHRQFQQLKRQRALIAGEPWSDVIELKDEMQDWPVEIVSNASERMPQIVSVKPLEPEFVRRTQVEMVL